MLDHYRVNKDVNTTMLRLIGFIEVRKSVDWIHTEKTILRHVAIKLERQARENKVSVWFIGITYANRVIMFKQNKRINYGGLMNATEEVTEDVTPFIEDLIKANKVTVIR